ncbi:adhesin transmembrane protein, partial [Mesorhizobium sp. LNHC252B00]|uniref:YadA-like family protein n=1 Tax=Mesorhizobium sp. LNHC252B00 TaxID=1287252 RepID=UPI0003CF36C7
GDGATAAASSGDVALGSGSATTTAVGTASGVVNGTTYAFQGTNPLSTVSIGAPGAERTLTNLAAGRVSALSTDAINGSQLFATNQAVDAIGAAITNINIGGIKYFHANSTAADSLASGTDSVAIGPVATATGTNAIAAGTNSSATDANASAFGSGAVASALDATAMGYISKASGQYSTAVGANANATATSSTAIGQNAFATGFQAAALGAGANAGAQNALALGALSSAGNAGDVALGSGSVTAVAVGTPSTVINGTTYAFQGTNPTSTVSVGAVGAERTITNVAAGRISGSSTDAINGSQLFATNQAVDAIGTTLSTIGGSLTNLGNTIANIAGDTSTAYTDANGIGIRYARTNEAGLAQTDSFAQGVGSTAVGYQATATGASALALGRDSNVSIDGGVALGSGSVSDRAVAPASGSILAGTGLVPYNTTDLTLLGAVSVGTSTSYRQITNVADGTEDQDAVSLRQLKGALSSFAVTGTKYFHANSTASDSLAVGTDSVAVGPRTTVNGDNGIGIGNGAIVQQTAPGGIAIGQNATVNQADSIAFGTNSTANGAQAMALGAGATANEPGSVALGAGSTTAAAVATTGTTINGVNYTFAGTAPTSTVSVGSAGNERTITNVAAGRISSTSTDAINGSQLYATNQAVEAVQGSVGDLAEFSVQYDKDVDGNKSNSLTLAGGDPNAPVVIHNVGAGVANNDAVNVKQLNDGLSLTLADSKTYTDQVAGTTLQQANNYTDQKLGQLNSDISGIRDEARQAAAIGLAAASLRYDDRPGKLSVAAGGGFWRDESAFAFGAGYTSEDGRIRGNVSGTAAGGDVGVGAGLSFTLN